MSGTRREEISHEEEPAAVLPEVRGAALRHVRVMTTLTQVDQILTAGIDVVSLDSSTSGRVLGIALSAMRDRARDLADADAGAYLPSNAGMTRRLWRVPWHAGDLIVAAHSDVDAAHQADSWLRAHPHLITGRIMPDWKGAEPLDSPVFWAAEAEAEQQVRLAEEQAERIVNVIMATLVSLGADPDNPELRPMVAAALRTAVS